MFNAFASRKPKHMNSSQTPFATLVKKLQESLTKMESFDVVTVAQNMDGVLIVFRKVSTLYMYLLDSKRSSPSLLARQLRLRLQADDNSDIPRNLHNIVVSIHAIATFQALHEYLRPRVAGLIGGGSRLSGMLAAIAAGLGGPLSGGNPDNNPPKDSGGTSDVAPAGTSSVSNAANDGPRRSRRLSAKTIGGSVNKGDDEGLPNDGNMPAESTTSQSQAGDSSAGPSSGETIYADFTDDEVDADVFDEEIDQEQSSGDKTVTLAVAEGMNFSL